MKRNQQEVIDRILDLLTMVIYSLSERRKNETDSEHRHDKKGGGQMNIQERRNKNGKITFTKKHGLQKIHPHMFRHTSVSLQLQAGISIADAAKRAGHARPDVTLRIYSHALKKNDLHCCEAVHFILLYPLHFLS